ncbi:Ovate protein family, C-terminal [Parasponia andersonii]|uniref:Transcription repressor n=1 Tax=Parasponia andersonii TaxID=3476 RepID=A0A2P5D9W5_PARAD|nr:Ovate protein family, C-terminal [Parasponia andersonii]
MASSTRKRILLKTVAVDLGCSCSRPKLSLLFHPKLNKPKIKAQKKSKRHHHSSSSASWNDDYDDAATTTTATSSSAIFSDDNKSSPRTTVRGFGRVGGDGVAVEKESDDPYLDFRQSMLQMILENEIYSKDDLRELLNCFLQLNSPSHHGIIVRAFTEIWDGVFSVRASAMPMTASTTTTTKVVHFGYNNNPTTSSRDYCYY